MRGGLIDIEFIVQYLQLKNATANPKILGTNTSDVLDKLINKKILNDEQFKVLNNTLKFWQTIQGVLRLTVQGYFKPVSEKKIPRALAQVLIGATGYSDLKALKSGIIDSAQDVFKIYKEIIGEPDKINKDRSSYWIYDLHIKLIQLSAIH